MTATITASVTTLNPATIGGLRVERITARDTTFNMLIYGKSGVGKTRLCGSASAVPEMSPVLILDIEGGLLTLRKDFPQIDTVRIKAWKDFQEVYSALFAGGHGYRTIVLDSLTEIQKFNMDQIMLNLVASNDDRDADVPSLREWGKNLEQTRRFVRAFRDLPYNVLFTALEQEKEDRMKRPVKLPSLSGKMAQEVAAFLDIVCYYNMKEVEGEQRRVLQTVATESTTAKDRSGLLPPVILDPTMADLYDYIIKKTQPATQSTELDASILTK
jgi:phage nucleotide-binding protein